MKTSEILTKAAEIMMERGHARASLVNDDGNVCLIGAVAVAMEGIDAVLAELKVNGERFYHLDELKYIARAIPGVIEPNRVWKWNDNPETTEPMVLGALHEASLLAKELGD